MSILIAHKLKSVSVNRTLVSVVNLLLTHHKGASSPSFMLFEQGFLAYGTRVGM